MKRFYRALLIGAIAFGGPAYGGSPKIFNGPEQNAGSINPQPPRPETGTILSIDGQGVNSSNVAGVAFSLGSEHVIRGRGFKNVVGAWLVSSRIPLRKEGGGNQYKSVGSVLTVVRQSETELVVRVTQIAGGKLPWSSANYRQNRPSIVIRNNGGGNEIRIQSPLKSQYRCATGEPNCI